MQDQKRLNNEFKSINYYSTIIIFCKRCKGMSDLEKKEGGFTMKTIKHETKYNQPEVYEQLIQREETKKQKEKLTTFFERIERTLDPICDAIRKAMRRLEINI